MSRARGRQRGAALLLAMLILTLVATLAAGMAWQQTRAVQIEAAERASVQAQWILDASLDWARLILREDGRTGSIDHLGEPWATPLAEARLSSFLAADRDNTDSGGPEAFISGAISDAQAKYNLRNLIDSNGKISQVELKALQRLCEAAGVPTDTPARLAQGLALAWAGESGDERSDVPLAPKRVADLAWLGLDPATVARLAPFVTLLPTSTPVNANTAPREVLIAAIDGLDLGSAERLVQTRQRSPFDSLEAVKALLPQGVVAPVASRLSVSSSYFEVHGRLRLEERIVEEESLVERRGADKGRDVVTLRRERHPLYVPQQ
ncbi:type II secretion system minor pseudopilin GspK [Rubrivivax gelatinosus]|uniref:Type II secretion system protein K n=1 Tax=Rubrivivax gelatinosus (strain NBRC 100245 / IL144) TaxID=983917 RepID=I0HMA5_RUBGI|nr:type II secretion system minor pseudopilin GspK [Rubrivivax gelatinosus]BAL94142.1 putative general secretion pathway protein K GspK [Rubrivivax gelatinosus IL144]